MIKVKLEMKTSWTSVLTPVRRRVYFFGILVYTKTWDYKE